MLVTQHTSEKAWIFLIVIQLSMYNTVSTSSNWITLERIVLQSAAAVVWTYLSTNHKLLVCPKEKNIVQKRLSYIHIICPLILNQRYSPVNSRNSNPHFPYIVTSPPLLPASPSWRPCNHLKGQSSHRMHPTGFTYAKGPKPRAQTHPNYCRAVTLSFSGGYSTDYQCKPQSPLVFQSCISSAFLSKKKKLQQFIWRGQEERNTLREVK